MPSGRGERMIVLQGKFACTAVHLLATCACMRTPPCSLRCTCGGISCVQRVNSLRALRAARDCNSR